MTTLVNEPNQSLLSIYAKPGPYVSAFVTRGEREQFDDRDSQLDKLVSAGASQRAVDAVAARLALPVYGDIGGQAIIASEDGTTITFTAHEGPDRDWWFFDSLPYAAPLFEWEQWKVPHLTVVAGTSGYEVVEFIPGSEPAVHPAGDDHVEATGRIGSLAAQLGAQLIVVGGDQDAADSLVPGLRGSVPAGCEVVEVELADGTDDEAFASEVVRLVSDLVARRTVATIREFRFLREHDAAAEGVENAFAFLAKGRGDLLVVHDDPTDTRRAYFGPGAYDVSPIPLDSCPEDARMVDLAIRTALLGGMEVRVIPSTGESGPDDNIAVLVRDPAFSNAGVRRIA